MSLTNPTAVVTEERLNEYHQTILPYLGGMPDILANKFSKSDLYSTDEKIIGQWTDGKPLYQKVVTFTSQNTAGKQQVTNFIGEANIDTCISIVGFGKDSGGFIFPIVEAVDGNTTITGVYSPSLDRFDITWNDSNAFNRLITCIVQYTKTTDSSVDIGVDTDYSTTEKIIGTWINGKPIYQKTVALSSAISVPANQWHFISEISTAGFDTLVDFIGYHISAKHVYHIDDCQNADGGLWLFSSCSSTIEVYTIQYTKTTD